MCTDGTVAIAAGRLKNAGICYSHTHWNLLVYIHAHTHTAVHTNTRSDNRYVAYDRFYFITRH